VRALVRECGADPVPALLTAALRADAEMTWMLVSGCGVDPASRNRHGEKALDLVPAESNEYRLLEWLEGLRNHPPDLGPGASRTDKSIAYGEWFYHRNDTPCKEQNDYKRAAGFLCPLCQYARRDGIACVPCGHRVCPGCWANSREQHMLNCPQCRAPIAHGEPQDSWPDRHPLYARFGVEGPRGSTATGVDWTLNSTTTDGLAGVVSAVQRAVKKTKSAVFGSKIQLKVIFQHREEINCEISKSESIYYQIHAKLKAFDQLESVQVCSDTTPAVVQFTIYNSPTIRTWGHAKFDADCNRAIATAEAKRPKKSFYLCVTVA